MIYHIFNSNNWPLITLRIWIPNIEISCFGASSWFKVELVYVLVCVSKSLSCKKFIKMEMHVSFECVRCLSLPGEDSSSENWHQWTAHDTSADVSSAHVALRALALCAPNYCVSCRSLMSVFATAVANRNLTKRNPSTLFKLCAHRHGYPWLFQIPHPFSTQSFCMSFGFYFTYNPTNYIIHSERGCKKRRVMWIFK